MSGIIDNKPENLKGEPKGKTKLVTDVDKNVDNLKLLMKNCGDFICRKFKIGKRQQIKIVISYIDGLVDRTLIDERIMKPMMLLGRNMPPEIGQVRDVYSFLKNGSITTADIKEYDSIDDIIENILIGDTSIMVEGSDKTIVISSRLWPNRGVQPPTIESVIRGPNDAFTEVFRFNTALMRRRIRDPRFKVEQMRIGERSKTDIGIMYIEDIVNKNVLRSVEKRLKSFNIDAIMDSGQIEHFIEDNRFSLFPQIQNTQRPDEAVAAILEGKVAIIVDNTPFVLIVPATLNSLMQVAEDYYERWTIVSVIRILRYVAALIAIGLTGLYISVINYHPDFIPVPLLLSIAAGRASVPFPAFLEAIFMEITVEILREAGARLPGPIGQTIGIVGGLVIGQAAVTAGIVSPIMVIIVAFTSICSFAIPNYNLTTGIRIIKFLLIIISAFLGFYGFLLGFMLLLIHLSKLKSFGEPYLSPFVSSHINDIKDSFWRAPVNMYRRRPSLVTYNKTRIYFKDRGDKDDKGEQ